MWVVKVDWYTHDVFKWNVALSVEVVVVVAPDVYFLEVLISRKMILFKLCHVLLQLLAVVIAK